MPPQKSALFFEQLDNDVVRCVLCPSNCVIQPGRVGVCGARRNVRGQLIPLNYNQVASMANDPIEKKPLYHFHPGSRVFSVGTYGCNLKCGFCQNHTLAHRVSGPAVKVEPAQLVELAKQNGCQGIAWTYNEPTIWFEYALEGAKLAKQAGLYTVFVTNGYINPEPLDMIGPFLDAYAVDIKAFNNDFYQKVCKIKDFQPILTAIERAKRKWNMHVEVTTLVIPTLNDSEAELKSIADWIVAHIGPETPWHLSRFFPYLEYQHLPPTPIETLKKAKEIGLIAGLKFVHLGNVPGEG